MFTKILLMCRFQELAVNKCGYVIRCNECQHYQVLVGGIVLSLSAEEFEQMKKEIRSAPAQQDIQAEDTRSVLLSTPKAGVHLWLTPPEVEDLCRLIDEADTEIKTLELFALFH